jgi:hypothetical protein
MLADGVAHEITRGQQTRHASYLGEITVLAHCARQHVAVCAVLQNIYSALRGRASILLCAVLCCAAVCCTVLCAVLCCVLCCAVCCAGGMGCWHRAAAGGA